MQEFFPVVSFMGCGEMELKSSKLFRLLLVISVFIVLFSGVSLAGEVSVNFNVTDEDEDPLEDISLKIFVPYKDDPKVSNTGSDGKVEFELDIGEEYFYSVVHEDYVGMIGFFFAFDEEIERDITLKESKHELTFNITDELGEKPLHPDVSLFDVDDNMHMILSVNESPDNYTFEVADGANYSYEIRGRGYDTLLNYTGIITSDKTINVSLNFSTFDGYVYYPNGSKVDSANITVETYEHGDEGEEIVSSNSTLTNESGYFNMGVQPGDHYNLDIKKWNDEGDVLEYMSISDLTSIREPLSKYSGTKFHLSSAVTFNIDAVGSPEPLENVSVLDENEVSNYSSSLVWMDDTTQWAYKTINESSSVNKNLTILESNFTENSTFEIPVNNSIGLAYNGSDFFTMNITNNGDVEDVFVFAFNKTGDITFDKNITNTTEDRYYDVRSIYYEDDNFYVLGRNGSEYHDIVLDKYNSSFDFKENVFSTHDSADDIHLHEGYWYFVDNNDIIKIDDEGNNVEGLGFHWHWQTPGNVSITGIARNDTNWIIGSNETSNISIVELSDKGEKKISRFSVEDSILKEWIINHHPKMEGEHTHESNFTFDGLVDRNYLLSADKRYTMMDVKKFIDPDYIQENMDEATRTVNITLNMTDEVRRVSGYVNLSDGTDSFDNISVMYYTFDGVNELEPKGNHDIFSHVNDSHPHLQDQYNASEGFFNISIGHPSAYDQSYMLFISAYNETDEQHYGAIKKVTLEKDGGPVTGFNTTLEPLLGENSGFEYGPDEKDFVMDTTLKKFQFVDSDENLIEDLGGYHIEIVMNYSKIWDDSDTFKWVKFPQKDIAANAENDSFELPVFGGEGAYANVFVHKEGENYAPRRVHLTESKLKSNETLNITIYSDEEEMDGLLSGFSEEVTISVFKGDTADMLNVDEDDIMASGSPHNMQFYNRLLSILGGNISFRMHHEESGMVVHYSNVDASLFGAPDARFGTDAFDFSEDDDIFKSLWKFGSTGPDIYDRVLIGLAYNDSGSSNVTINFTHLYDEKEGKFISVWNASEGGVSDITSDNENLSHFTTYVDSKYESYINGSGVQCSFEDNELEEGLCHVDVTEGLAWFEIPHFSGVGVQTQQEPAPDEIWVNSSLETLNNTHTNTIASGVRMVAENGTVNVYPGVYNETVIIEKPLTLQSTSKANETIIKIDENNEENQGIIIFSNNVTVDGFNITDVYMGVTIFESEEINISNNIIEGTGETEGELFQTGIAVANSSGVKINNNNISNNHLGVDTALMKMNSSDIELVGNNILGIGKNSEIDPPPIGIISSENCINLTLEGNNVSNNFIGSAIMGEISPLNLDFEESNNFTDNFVNYLKMEEEGKVKSRFSLGNGLLEINFDGENPFDATSVTVLEDWQINVTNVSVVLPNETELTRTDGGNFNAIEINASSVDGTDLNVTNESYGALEFGIPELGLEFSQSVNISVNVSEDLDEQNITIFRSVQEEGPWTQDGLENKTCEVVDGFCKFQANKASYFVLGDELSTFDLKISSTSGGSVTNPGEGTFGYVNGTVVDLVAEANSGYEFDEWTGDTEEIDNTGSAETTINMSGNFEITAEFEEEEDDDDDNGNGDDTSPPRRSPPAPEPEVPDFVEEIAEYDPETGVSNLEIDAKKGQEISINISKDAMDEEASSNIESISASAVDDSKVSISVSRVSMAEAAEEAQANILANQFDFSKIDMDGDIEDITITFTVRKDVIEEREAEPEDVIKQRLDDDWVDLETTLIEETDNKYRFESKTEAMSLYAISLKEEEEEEEMPPLLLPDIQIIDTKLSSTETQAGEEIEIEVDLENAGDARGSKNIEFSVDGQVNDSKEVELEAGEETTITFTYKVLEGEQELSIQGESVGTVTGVKAEKEEPPEEDGFSYALLFIAIIAGLLIIGGAVLIFKPELLDDLKKKYKKIWRKKE